MKPNTAASRPCHRLAATLVGLGSCLPACLSTAPPAPPIRWFDPTPMRAAADAPHADPVDLRVVAAPHLGREFVVRIAERELAFDGQHGWIDEPGPLVAAALAQVVGLSRPGGQSALVEVAVFELDLTAAPRAHVQLVVQTAGAQRVLDAWAPAADRAPASFAAAMASALADAATQAGRVIATAGAAAAAAPPVSR